MSAVSGLDVGAEETEATVKWTGTGQAKPAKITTVEEGGLQNVAVAQALSEQASLDVNPIQDQAKVLLHKQECVGLDQTKFGDYCQRGRHTRKKPS